jgi:hypothetical protein
MTPKFSFSFAEAFLGECEPIIEEKHAQIEDTDKTNCKQKTTARIKNQLVKWSKEEDSLIKQHIQLGETKEISLIPPDIQAVATLATNIAIVISLLVVATNVYLQRKSTNYNTYEKLMSDFSGTASILIDRPEILEIYVKGTGKPTKWDQYSESEKRTFAYFNSLLALMERVWFGVPKKDWKNYYSKWVKDLATNELFLDVYNHYRKIYDASFTRKLDDIIKDTEK